MAGIKKKIYIIYSSDYELLANKTKKFLLHDLCAIEEENLEGKICLKTYMDICKDSAIVFVSDQAVTTDLWQRNVRELPEHIRLIPIGRIEKSDYNNPEVVPSQIEAINFIIENEKLFRNVIDSLTIDDEFYFIRNELRTLMHYKQSFRNVYKIRKYFHMINKRLKTAESKAVRDELLAMLQYLNNCYIDAIINIKSSIKRNLIFLSTIIIGIYLIVLWMKIEPCLKLAGYESVLLEQDFSKQFAKENAVKLYDAITNPLVPDYALIQLYDYLFLCLDENWTFTPIGINYMWKINDACFSTDKGYLYTANENGMIIKWNMNNGEIVQREKVSDNSLLTFCVTKDEGFFVALDSQGKLFFKDSNNKWIESNIKYTRDYGNNIKVEANEDGNYVLISHSKAIMLLCKDKDFLCVYDLPFENIMNSSLHQDGSVSVARKGVNNLIIDEISTTADIKETIIDVLLGDECKLDIDEERMIFSDLSGQILLWNHLNPNIIEKTGLILKNPLELKLSGYSFFAYSDKNIGTHIYDIDNMIDLGCVLPETATVENIFFSDDYIGVKSNSIVYSEDICKMLPEYTVPLNAINVYSQKEAEGKGVVKKVTIKNDYMIVMKVYIEDEVEPRTVVIDGAHRYNIGKKQQDRTLMDGVEDKNYYYLDLPIDFVGKPTVVGLTNKSDTVLIGTYDGKFYEICVNEKGGAMIASKMQVVTHSPIKSIIETNDMYLLNDNLALYWKARKGYPIVTGNRKVLTDEIRNKLCSAVSEDLVKTVSPETIDVLRLKIIPGDNGKVWE